MRLLFFCFLFFCVCPELHAQIQADTLLGAEVHAQRDTRSLKDEYASGIKRKEIDAATLEIFRQQSLGALLAARSLAFVKSTGLNSFSTLSLRGASAAQTAVYWEGVPLMNSASGLVDVSLMPLTFAGKVWIDYGSSAALRGSGNVGGAIMLSDEQPYFQSGQEWRGAAGLTTGSFSQYGAEGHASYSSKYAFANVGISATTADNNFPAEDEQGKSYLMPHAAQRQWNGSALLAYQPDARTLFSLHSQVTSSHREIPPALFEAQSTKQQDNQDIRLLLQWQQSDKRHPALKHYAKLALLNNVLAYSDSSIGLYSNLHTPQVFAEAGWEASFLKNGKLLVFAPLQYSWLKEREASQFRAALAGALSVPFFLKKNQQQYALRTALNFRIESFNGTWITLPGANLSLLLAGGWKIRGNAQYTYRAPTLNELYYQPGGNDQLRPEHGWSYDAGLEWEVKRTLGWSHKHNISVYQRDIHDWIIWLGGAIWTPHNLALVRSRGIETGHELSWRTGKFYSSLSIEGALISSRMRSSSLTADSSVGKQLPYVPPAMANATLDLGWNRMMIQWSTAFVGLRYTLSDESDWLDAYSVSNLSLVFTVPMKAQILRFQAMLQNIFNTPYQVVAYRPMPGFNWNFGASIYLRNGAE